MEPAPTFGQLRLWLWLPLSGACVSGAVIALFAPEFWGVPVAVAVDVLGWSLVAQLVLRRRRLSLAGAAWASAAVALGAMLTFLIVVRAGDELLSLVGYWPRNSAPTTVTEFLLGGLLGGLVGLVLFGWLVLPLAAGTGALAWRHHHRRLARTPAGPAPIRPAR